jgi:hypothetical protein
MAAAAAAVSEQHYTSRPSRYDQHTFDLDAVRGYFNQLLGRIFISGGQVHGLLLSGARQINP